MVRQPKRKPNNRYTIAEDVTREKWENSRKKLSVHLCEALVADELFSFFIAGKLPEKNRALLKLQDRRVGSASVTHPTHAHNEPGDFADAERMFLLRVRQQQYF